MVEKISAGRFSIPVLYEDNHVIVAVKPPNMPVQADSSRDLDMLTALKNHIGIKYQKPGNVYMGLVHRLDRPVGGVMVFARTSKAASRLSAAFAGHEQKKIYLAVVRGEVATPMDLQDYLCVDSSTGTARLCGKDASGAKLAKLKSCPIACRSGLTLCRVELFTGRKHQIRVQHAGHGFPLWGDARYGNGKPGEQIALWAHTLAFDHPTRHEEMRFFSLPDMQGAWRLFEDVLKELPNA